MITSETGRVVRIARLVDAGEQLELSRDDLLRQVRLAESDLADPDKRVPVGLVWKLWQHLAAAVPEPELGVRIGATFDIRQAGVVGYAMRHSLTLHRALLRLVRYSKVLNQRSEVSLEREGPAWRLRQASPPLLADFRQPIDEIVAGVVTGLSQLVGKPIRPLGMRLTYPRPDETRELRGLVGGNLTFSHATLDFLFRPIDVESALLEADPQLAGYLDTLADQALESLPADDSFAERVRRATWPSLADGQPGIDQISTELAVSSRTLQRRLREEGTTFARVIEELRKGKAAVLLRDNRLAVYEVGYLLGYSDPSAFFRAFRRWYGASPSEFRRNLD